MIKLEKKHCTMTTLALRKYNDEMKVTKDCIEHGCFAGGLL